VPFDGRQARVPTTADGSAHELMAIEEDTKAELKAFLLQVLADGPVSTREVKAAAAANGYKWRTMERAKTDLGITPTKGHGATAPWYWALPSNN
jgi:putative DNA primase/helicase